MIKDPTVVCDRCDVAEEFDLTPLANRSWDCRNLSVAMKRAGWVKDDDGHTYCEDCSIDQETS